MSKENITTGDDQNNPTPPKDEVDPTPPKGADINQKLMEELKKSKEKAKELETKIKQREVEDLKANQHWQQLAELKEKEANEAKEEATKLKTAVINDKKMTALREAAMGAGLRKESIDDLALIDFPELTLETVGEGKFTATGADKAVQRLKTLRPHWFKSGAPKVNTSSPEVTGDGSGALAAEQAMDAAQLEYDKNKTPANAEKLKSAIIAYKRAGAK